MRIFLILYFLFGTISWCLSQSPRQGQDHALFFAVSNYEDDGLTDLPQSITNARTIAGELERRFAFITEVVEDPTLEEIENKLSEYKNRYDNGRLPKTGQLFIFFSGHGVKEYNNGYFLPADADPDRVFRTGLAYDIWRPYLDGINCQHILVAVDACYSVTFDPNWKSMGNGDSDRFRRKNELSESERLLANHQQFPSRLFFTSDAQEDVVPGRSNFARKLLDGLANSYSRVSFLTAEELFSNYVKKAQPTPNGGDFGRDDVRSNFLFFYKPVANLNDTRADRTAWQRAQEEKTMAAYRLYLQEHPNGDFRMLAEQELENLEAEDREIRAWETAKTTNTRKGYQDFINTYPNSLYRQPAEIRRDALLPAVGKVSPPDDMVLVQGGTFQMGSNDGDDDEKPVHSVKVSDFYIDRFEVTVADFSRFVQATNYKTDAEKDGGSYFWENDEWTKKPGINWRYDTQGKIRPANEYNHPVIHISWNDAVAYCNWLSEQHQYQPVYTIKGEQVTVNWKANGYRLPTEAEWEFADRSRGKDYKYAWGNGTPNGNIADESAKKVFSSWTIWDDYSDGYVYTAPVGQFEQGDLGLFDMTGNVWEWCWDWKATSSSSSPQTNPRGPDSGSYRVLRGGSWNYGPAYLRCAFRNRGSPGSQSYDIGFRLSRAAR